MTTDYSAKIICDSIAKDVRLTTFEVTFPRFVLAEFNTHRVFSRNSASSRAIPVLKQIQRVLEFPFIPRFKHNQKGMQPGELFTDEEQAKAEAIWIRMRDFNAAGCKELAELDVHKQWANRPLEWAMWHTAVVTATEFENFFALRNHPMAQDEIRILAELMEPLYRKETPREAGHRYLHLPYLTAEELDTLSDDRSEEAIVKDMLSISSARCARVSYLTHDGRRDFDEDRRLHDDLLGNRHMSPFEHCATNDWSFVGHRGNFVAPWVQYRKTIPNEAIAPRAVR